MLGPGYYRALSGDLDLDGATTLLKGISTTNYEYEEWLRMLGTHKYFAQAQCCLREAVCGGACLPHCLQTAETILGACPKSPEIHPRET